MAEIDPTTGEALTAFLKILLALLLLPYYILEAFLSSIFCWKQKDIDGNIVLITGGANGIGKELAKQLLALNCKTILLVDIKKEDLDQTVNELRDSQGRKDCAKGYICDITDPEAVNKLRDDVIDEFGYVDILFNNAGILYPSNSFESSCQNVKRVIDVNVVGHIWMTRAFLPLMKKRQKGHICFTSSILGFMHRAETAIYCLTKSAITVFALCLVAELENEPEWKDIKISIPHPIHIESNAFMAKTIKTTYISLPLRNAARGIIEGVRQNLVEYLVPGGAWLMIVVKATRLAPGKFRKALRKSMIITKKKMIDEEFLSDLMGDTSIHTIVERLHDPKYNPKP